MRSTDQAAAQSVTQYRARHILVREDGDAAAAKARIDILRARIAGGAGFAEVAKEESDDTFSKDKRSEEHKSELQSLMRISYAVFCLKNKHYSTPKQYTTSS